MPMYEEDETNEEHSDDKTCPNCGLRQYNSICANCEIPIEQDEDPDKKKEDEYDDHVVFISQCCPRRGQDLRIEHGIQ